MILVHGLGVSSRYMLPLLRDLAASVPVWAPDLPGFGRSDKPRQPLDVPGLAAALAAWLEVQGLGGAAVVANSFGCQVAVDLAAHRPDLVGALVLTEPTVDPAARRVRTQVQRWVRNAPAEPPSLAAVMVRDYADCGVRRLWRTVHYALTDRIEEKLPAVRAPTLVVRGGRDVIVPQSWAVEVTALLPHGQLAVIPGAGHTVNYNAPADLARLARPLLTG